MDNLNRLTILATTTLLLAGCASHARVQPSSMMSANPRAMLRLEVTPVAYYCRNQQWPTAPILKNAVSAEAIGQSTPFQHVQAKQISNRYQITFKLKNDKENSTYIYDYTRAPALAECQRLSIKSTINKNNNVIRSTITPTMKS